MAIRSHFRVMIDIWKINPSSLADIFSNNDSLEAPLHVTYTSSSVLFYLLLCLHAQSALFNKYFRMQWTTQMRSLKRSKNNGIHLIGSTRLTYWISWTTLVDTLWWKPTKLSKQPMRKCVSKLTLFNFVAAILNCILLRKYCGMLWDKYNGISWDK